MTKAEELVNYICHRFSSLETKRANYESQWKDINKYIIPERGKNFGGKHSEGRDFSPEIFDSTAIKSCEDLASGLQSMLTSPSARWFNLSPGDAEILQKSVAARTWIQYVENLMYFVFQSPAMKFYSNAHQCYLDLAGFGTAVMLIEPNIKKKRIKYKALQLDECYIDENSDGEVDTVFRKFDYTARQILEEFGDKLNDKLKTELNEAADKTPLRTYEIIHAVYPRITRNEQSLLPINMKYASVYISVIHKEILSESGYKEFPYVVPRWYTRSGEVYGVSPGMICIADVRMLNQMSRTTIKGARRKVEPAYQLPDDGFLAPIDLRADALNYHRPGMQDELKPIAIQGDIGLGLEMEEQRRNAIRSAFYADLMFDNKTARMATTEVLQREEARMRVMAPQLGRLHVEFMSPVITKTFLILDRFGLIPPVPQELATTYLKPDYVSPVARAQKVLQASNVQRMFEQMAGFAQISPEVFDNISPDGLSNWLVDLYDAPTSILRSEEEVQAIKEQRQQQTDTQNQMSMLQQGIDMAQKTGMLGGQGA